MSWLNFKALLDDKALIDAFDVHYQKDQHEKLTLFFYVTLLHTVYDHGECDSPEEKEEFAHSVIKDINERLADLPCVRTAADRLNMSAFLTSMETTLKKIGEAGTDVEDRMELVMRAAEAYATSYQKAAKTRQWDVH